MTNEVIQLTEAIIRATSADKGIDVVNLVTAITALVAVISGTIVGVYGVTRQTRATVHSQHRQAWINVLRDNVASLLTKYQKVKGLLMKEGAIDQDAIIALTFEAKQLELIIALQLNPAESDHESLLELLHQTSLMVVDDKQDINDNEKKIVRLTQKVLKREWERVKALK